MSANLFSDNGKFKQLSSKKSGTESFTYLIRMEYGLVSKN
jgi:hypothetical protein